ncbi:GNAT family N-acetyltransferase [Candidatus Woesearchaeota archaeon]|nr:GNAT family N-acetyltransferase [Candidatus Woesearchaeota archaeon]
MIIRTAKHEDLKQIIGLLKQLSPSSEEDDFEKLKQILEKITEDEFHYLCVVEEDHKIVGSGTLLIQKNLGRAGKPYGHIENIVVDMNHRKKGIGKEIIFHLIEKAKEHGCYKVILDCKKENIPFYEKCGMKETGEVSMRMDFN